MWQIAQAMIIVDAVFNTFLGEEFLLRGVLLPKMRGVFRLDGSKRDGEPTKDLFRPQKSEKG